MVPTLGLRPDLLLRSLESITKAGCEVVNVVANKDLDTSSILARFPNVTIVDDPGLGLPAAINIGIESFSQHTEYVGWLGDDDYLTPNSLHETVSALDSSPSNVLAYGSCHYVDQSRRILMTNKSGKWAAPLLHFGPDLIPQPGMLFRRQAFNEVGGLSSDYDLCFDLDLLLKLKQVGRFVYIPKVLGHFCWHPGSLSVKLRKKSVRQASAVRLAHLPKPVKPFAQLWELPVRWATYLAGKGMSARATFKGEVR